MHFLSVGMRLLRNKKEAFFYLDSRLRASQCSVVGELPIGECSIRSSHKNLMQKGLHRVHFYKTSDWLALDTQKIGNIH